MILLIAGLVVFLGIHSVSIVAPRWRMEQVALRGEKRWKGIFSIVSLVGFVLLVWGYALSRHDPVLLYSPPTALRHLTLLLMVPVFPLLFASSLPGRISRAVKHPMLLAVKIWALAHLLANGTLGDTVLFGAFLAWAVIDRIAVKRRPVELSHEPVKPAGPKNDVIAVVGGLITYVVFILFLHRWLIGVSPIG